MLRLMEAEDLSDRIVERVRAGMAVLATCAGVIVLARSVVPLQPSLGLLAVDIERNAYGRQRYSTVSDIELSSELGAPEKMEAVFIRAPRITDYDDNVEVLGWWGDDVVLVRQDRVLAATFHPEITGDRRVHELFLKIEEA
jgi:5'-phosphate synthase pdxT subunit